MLRKLRKKWQQQNRSLNKPLDFGRGYTNQIYARDYRLFYMYPYIICKRTRDDQKIQ